MRLGSIIIILLTLTACVTISIAEATPVIKGPKLYTDKSITGNYGNIIAVELSPSCLALAKINATSQCPTYLDLQKFDTTNPKNAGKFGYEDVFYHRGKPFYKNYQLSYSKDRFPLLVCVDCSKQIIDHSKVVYVKSSDSFMYVPKDKPKMTNNTRIQFEARFIDAKCETATIAWSPWLLNDTINYLFHNCKTSLEKPTTQYNETKLIYKKPSKATLDGAWYKYMKWLAEAKKHKTENCLKSDKC